MVAGTDQARDSANQIPAREFPHPASPSLPSQPGPTIPPCDQAEELDTASSLGLLSSSSCLHHYIFAFDKFQLDGHCIVLWSI